MPSLPWVQSNSFLVFFIFFVAIYLLRGLLVKQLQKKAYLFYLLFYPGVFLHELSHLIGCEIAGARVISVKFVSKTGGEVVHEKAKLPLVGNFLVSVFPLILGSFFVYLTIKILAEFGLSNTSLVALILIKAACYYLLVAVLLTTFPSVQDVKNAILGYISLIAILAVIAFETNWHVPTGVLNAALLCVITLSVVNLIMYIFNLLKSK